MNLSLPEILQHENELLRREVARLEKELEKVTEALRKAMVPALHNGYMGDCR